MTRYYAEAFKTGTYPTITEDKIYMWSRPHPKDASASNDSVDKPANFDMVSSPPHPLVHFSALPRLRK